jgi:hypothetical protein
VRHLTARRTSFRCCLVPARFFRVTSDRTSVMPRNMALIVSRRCSLRGTYFHSLDSHSTALIPSFHDTRGPSRKVSAVPIPSNCAQDTRWRIYMPRRRSFVILQVRTFRRKGRITSLFFFKLLYKIRKTHTSS